MDVPVSDDAAVLEDCSVCTVDESAPEDSDVLVAPFVWVVAVLLFVSSLVGILFDCCVDD